MNKGKVPRHEWPAIVRRHEAGESFAVISRDYGCSAPAIRYIVNRFDHLPATGQTGSAAVARTVSDDATAEPSPDLDTDGLPLAPDASGRSSLDFAAAPGESEALMAEQRATSDIASILDALEAALIERSSEHLEPLLAATDR